MTVSASNDAFRDYLKVVGRVPLLSPSEELLLGGIVRKWLTHPSPPEGLIRRGMRARNRMVSANLRLVVMICKRYLNSIRDLQLDVLDLIQAGNLGLIRAAERFDPCLGYKFSTYAFWWIRQSIKSCMSECGRPIRIPVQMLSLAYGAAQLQATSATPLSLRAMAESMGEDEGRLQKAITAVRQCQPVSLDKPVMGMEEAATLLDLIGDPHSLRPRDDYQWLHEQLTSLDGKERQLLQLRYGQSKGRSLVETAHVMGMTKSSVQKTERQVFRKLRSQLSPVLNPPRAGSISRISCQAGAGSV